MCAVFVAERGTLAVSARTDDILWDAKLKVAPCDKQNTGFGAGVGEIRESYELHSSVD